MQLPARLRQRQAELSRLGPLVLGVVPALLRCRFAREESLLHAALEQARRRPSKVALLCGDERCTYAELASRVDAYAAHLEDSGIAAGDVVGLVGENSLDYVTLLLALSRLGAAAALVSAELDGALLSRAFESARCRAVLVDAPLAERVATAFAGLRIVYGDAAFRELTRPRRSPRAPLPNAAEGDFAFVFSSGTTGVSKACRVSHRRARLSATAFGRLVHGLKSSDVLYCSLPLYHASPLLLGLGASLVAGATLALRPRFSASALLADVQRCGATVLLYVGELGRAWLAQPPTPDDRRHKLRVLVGNGMNARVWAALRERFGIAHVREFYAASEFPGAVCNITDELGSVGHLPLGRWRGYRLVRVDADSGAVERDAQGRAIECRDGEAGELVLRLRTSRERPTGDYLGYVGEAAASERVAHDLFEPGDAYCRSGDLLRRDRGGHFFFVDRLGDTFRFKSENVSTREVEEAFAGLPGVRSLVVVGVSLSSFDGKLGLAVLEVAGDFSLAAFAERAQSLPKAMRPCFVRLTPRIALTPSLKYKKADLARQGVDPSAVPDALFFRAEARFEPLDAAIFQRILRGETRF
ncbi:MAG: AMP-binding protein [Polyangiaceae bacterium]